MLLKERIVRLSKRAGAIAGVRDSAWRRRRLTVLCYHGVSLADEHEWSPELYMPAEMLAERLHFLRSEGYAILPVGEALDRLYSGTLTERSVSVTFDDGFSDFSQRALPVLREFSAPATVYFTTYYSTARVPVFSPVLSYILWKGRHCTRAAPRIPELSHAIDASSTRGRDTTWKALRTLVDDTRMNVYEQNALAERVATALHVDFAEILARGILQIMPPELAQALPADLVNLQLHTHRHRTATDRASFHREIEENGAIIRALRGTQPVLDQFCYPSGHYHREAMGWLAEVGVRYALTCVPGTANSRTHRMIIPRYVDSASQPLPVFESWVSGFADWLPRRSHGKV
jgi:peptidoglycan/xylan/chitin deacetylase (PgdA/CDA1 family)